LKGKDTRFFLEKRTTKRFRKLITKRGLEMDNKRGFRKWVTKGDLEN
jgi:hypothetical protein